MTDKVWRGIAGIACGVQRDKPGVKASDIE